MIKSIIFIAKKIDFVKAWIENFIQVYSLSFPAIEAPKESKQFYEEMCRKDLERISRGIQKPRILPQPK